MLVKAMTIFLEGSHFSMALQAVATLSHKKVIQLLLKSDADVNTQGESRVFPFPFSDNVERIIGSYTAIPDVTGTLWSQRSLESTERPMDSKEYTPLWIPMGWPLNLNESALGILWAGHCAQEEPEYTERIYFEQGVRLGLKTIYFY
jgi:hypothetical protein